MIFNITNMRSNNSHQISATSLDKALTIMNQVWPDSKKETFVKSMTISVDSTNSISSKNFEIVQVTPVLKKFKVISNNPFAAVRY